MGVTGPSPLSSRAPVASGPPPSPAPLWTTYPWCPATAGAAPPLAAVASHSTHGHPAVPQPGSTAPRVCPPLPGPRGKPGDGTPTPPWSICLVGTFFNFSFRQIGKVPAFYVLQADKMDKVKVQAAECGKARCSKWRRSKVRLGQEDKAIQSTQNIGCPPDMTYPLDRSVNTP